MRTARFSRALKQRLLFLVLGNVALLGSIGLLLREGASFADVVGRAGPDVAPVVLAGLGMTGIVFAGAIDLSVGSVLAVAGTVFGILVHRGVAPVICFGAVLVTVWGLAMANGYLVRGLGVQAIIVTLAGLPLYRGLALVLADLGVPDFSGNISVQQERYHLPGKTGAGWILAAGLGLALLLELFSQRPRRWLALGNSEEACRLMGLPPGRILQSAFGVGGFFLGLGALVYVTQVQAIEPARMALGFELQVIGAVVLGGTNIFGGEGSLAGTVLGAFFLYFIGQVLIYAEASPYIRDAMTGAIILGVIGMDCALHRKRKLLEELG